ncbi:MAG: hypothetical protein IBX55_17000 [Methyloprofundus sp.]|nr:hypothetical protein [Methyloprofundus sp.]
MPVSPIPAYSAIMLLKFRFMGVEEAIGDVLDFDQLTKRTFDVFDKGCSDKAEVVKAVTDELFEFGCFDVRVYDRLTRARWDPIQEAYSEFVARHPDFAAYVDHKPNKSLSDVHDWLFNFF